MSGDDEQLNRVLRAARRGFEPRIEDKLRLRRSLAHKLAVGGSVLGVSSVAWGALGAKTLLVVAALGAVSSVWFVRNDGGEADQRPTPRLLPRVTQSAQPASPASVVQPTEELPIVPIEELAKVAADDSTARPPAEPVGSLLAEEAALLLKARSALRLGQPQNVLTLLASYESRFHGGVLRQEVHGTRILALCDLGRTSEASRAAKSFTRRWPSSPMAARLATSCVGDRVETPSDP